MCSFLYRNSTSLVLYNRSKLYSIAVDRIRQYFAASGQPCTITCVCLRLCLFTSPARRTQTPSDSLLSWLQSFNINYFSAGPISNFLKTKEANPYTSLELHWLLLLRYRPRLRSSFTDVGQCPRCWATTPTKFSRRYAIITDANTVTVMAWPDSVGRCGERFGEQG